MCYNSRAHCPLLQCISTTIAILAGPHPYLWYHYLGPIYEGKNSCHDLIPNPRIYFLMEKLTFQKWLANFLTSKEVTSELKGETMICMNAALNSMGGQHRDLLIA